MEMKSTGINHSVVVEGKDKNIQKTRLKQKANRINNLKAYIYIIHSKCL